MSFMEPSILVSRELEFSGGIFSGKLKLNFEKLSEFLRKASSSWGSYSFS